VRKLGAWLLSDNRYAIIAVLLCSLLLLVPLPGDFLAGIIIGLVTLRRGALYGFYLLLILALLALGVTWHIHEFNLFVFLLFRGFLVWLGAILLKRFYSWTMTLEIMTLLGLGLILFAHFVIPDLSSIWQHALTNYINSWKNTVLAPTKTEWQYFKHYILPMATGLAVLFGLVGVLLQLFIARWWQARLFASDGFAQEFAMIRTSRFASAGLLVGIILILIFPKVLINYAPVLFLPFIMSGFSFLYIVSLVKRRWWSALLVFGLILVFFLFITIVLLTLVGFIDSWIDLRTRFNLIRKK